MPSPMALTGLRPRAWCFGSSRISQQKTPVSLGVHCLSGLIKSAANPIKPRRQEIIILNRPCPCLVEIIPVDTSKALPVAPPQPPRVRDTLNPGWETCSTIAGKLHRAEIPCRQKHVTVSGRSAWVCNVLNCHKEKHIGTITDQVLCKYQRSQIIPAVPWAIQVVVTMPSIPKVLCVPLWEQSIQSHEHVGADLFYKPFFFSD